MLANHFGKQVRWNRRDHESDDREAQRMRRESPVAALASRKCGQKFRDALAEINGQNGDRAQLDRNRVHFPITAIQAHIHQRFSNAQMRGRADGQILRQSFNDAKQHGQKIIVQVSSRKDQSVHPISSVAPASRRLLGLSWNHKTAGKMAALPQHAALSVRYFVPEIIIMICRTADSCGPFEFQISNFKYPPQKFSKYLQRKVSAFRRVAHLNQILPHLKSVTPPPIIILDCYELTIAMLSPKGNRSFVGCCGFKNHAFPASRGPFLLARRQQQRTDPLAPIVFENVQRDDMSLVGGQLGQDESRDVAARFRHQAIAALRAKINFHLEPSIRDPLGKADLVDPIESFKIRGEVRAQLSWRRSHAAGSQFENYGKNQWPL